MKIIFFLFQLIVVIASKTSGIDRLISIRRIPNTKVQIGLIALYFL